MAAKMAAHSKLHHFQCDSCMCADDDKPDDCSVQQVARPLLRGWIQALIYASFNWWFQGKPFFPGCNYNYTVKNQPIQQRVTEQRELHLTRTETSAAIITALQNLRIQVKLTKKMALIQQNLHQRDFPHVQ